MFVPSCGFGRETAKLFEQLTRRFYSKGGFQKSLAITHAWRL